MNERSICREPDVPAGRELQSAVEHQERPDANVQQFSKVQGSQRRRFVDTHHNIIMLNTHTKRRKWTFEGNARNGNIIEKWKRSRSKAGFGTKIASSSCPNVVFFIIMIYCIRILWTYHYCHIVSFHYSIIILYAFKIAITMLAAPTCNYIELNLIMLLVSVLFRRWRKSVCPLWLILILSFYPRRLR